MGTIPIGMTNDKWCPNCHIRIPKGESCPFCGWENADTFSNDIIFTPLGEED